MWELVFSNAGWAQMIVTTVGVFAGMVLFSLFKQVTGVK